MADQDDVFAEITDETESPAIVVFMQQPDEVSPDYDLLGDVELDEAITLVVKGLFSMVLDSLGYWDDDDTEDDEDPAAS